MLKRIEIVDVHAREVLDSRGNPTVEVEVVIEKNIHTLWFEAHYMYRKHLEKFAHQFAPVEVKFRCGIETFDVDLREKWVKGVGREVTAMMLLNIFKACACFVALKVNRKNIFLMI